MVQHTLIVIAGLVGCGATKKPTLTFRDFTTGDSGKLPADLDVEKIEAEYARPSAERGEFVYQPSASTMFPNLEMFVSFAGVNDGKICFEYRGETTTKTSGDEYMTGVMQRLELVVDVVPSLESVSARPIYPWPGAPLSADKVIDVSDKSQDTEAGEVWTRHVTFSFCGAAPKMGPTAKHLIVVAHARELSFTDGTSTDDAARVNGVLIWDLIE